MTLQSICDLVVLVGAAYFTILKVVNSLAKPTSKFKQREREKEEKKIRFLVEEILAKELQRIKEEINKNTDKKINEIKNINVDQSQEIDKIGDRIKSLESSSRDVLKQRIMDFYHLNKATRTIKIYDKECLDDLYAHYKKQDGSSEYMDRCYKRMCSWTVIYDEEK